MRRPDTKTRTTFPPTLLGWAIKHARKSLWRLAGVADLDDLIQDAHLMFLICAKRYWYVVDDRHFTALYKTAYTNMVNLAVRSHGPAYKVDVQADQSTCDNAHVLTMLAEAPKEVRAVLAASWDDNSKWTRRYRKAKIQHRDTTNSRLRRLIGAPNGTDVGAIVRNYLDGGTT